MNIKFKSETFSLMQILFWDEYYINSNSWENQWIKQQPSGLKHKKETNMYNSNIKYESCMEINSLLILEQRAIKIAVISQY